MNGILITIISSVNSLPNTLINPKLSPHNCLKLHFIHSCNPFVVAFFTAVIVEFIYVIESTGYFSGWTTEGNDFFTH